MFKSNAAPENLRIRRLRPFPEIMRCVRTQYGKTFDYLEKVNNF